MSITRRHLLVMSAGLLAACSGPATPSASPSSPTLAPGAASTAPTANSAAAPAQPSTSGSSALSEVIAGAKREGVVNWAITPDFVDGAQEIRGLVKSQYGVDLTVNSNAQLNYSEKASKAISELQAGATPSYDLLDLSDSSLTPMLTARAARVIDWATYMPDLPKEAVVRGVLLVVRDSFLLPAYNPNVIQADAAPKSYDDFLAPQWKGKLTVINAMSNWTWLAQPGLWGEQKLVQYIRQLFAQQPAVDRYAGMLSRLLSGEYPIATGLDSGSVWLSQRKGQPMATVPVSPIRDAKYGGVVAENAPHPNAAILTALVQVSSQGQAILDRVTAQSAAWVKGTTAAKFAAANKVVPVDVDFQEANQDRIVKQLDQIARS